VRNTVFYAVLLAALILVPSTANSQIYTPPINFNPQIGARMVQPQLDAQQRRADQDDAENDEQFVVANPSALNYSASKSRTRVNLQNFVSKSRAVDPESAAQLEQMFAASDIIGEIGRVMQEFGLEHTNTADAFAVYWISAWQAVNGDTSTRSARVYQAVAAQAASGMLQTSELAMANDSAKQEMAEAMMVQAILIDANLKAARSDPGQLKALAKAVKQGAAASGLDLGSMTLTEDGFVPKKGRRGADASGAVGDEEVKQQRIIRPSQPRLSRNFLSPATNSTF
jgi:hypothetical protein